MDIITAGPYYDDHSTTGKVAATVFLGGVVLLVAVLRPLLGFLVVRLWPPFVRRLTAARSPFLARLAIRLALARDRAAGAPVEAVYGAAARFERLQEVFERFPSICDGPALAGCVFLFLFLFLFLFGLVRLSGGWPGRGRARGCAHGGARWQASGATERLGNKRAVGVPAPRDLHWCFAPLRPHRRVPRHGRARLAAPRHARRLPPAQPLVLSHFSEGPAIGGRGSFSEERDEAVSSGI